MLRARPTEVVEAMSYHIGRNLLYGILGVSIVAIIIAVFTGLAAWIAWADHYDARFYRAAAWVALVALVLAVVIDLTLCAVILSLLPGSAR